jgi:hypothetical protein
MIIETAVAMALIEFERKGDNSELAENVIGKNFTKSQRL